ncbi:MAG: hypothetical protein A4E42_02481 [Methanoregulaceae archaeon PtaU1.Bin222]|nr:MAG: hypothetical protein A4E42_02481 [Methanoregulaceae archaeon PtaU1.Bin222]
MWDAGGKQRGDFSVPAPYIEHRFCSIQLEFPDDLPCPLVLGLGMRSIISGIPIISFHAYGLQSIRARSLKNCADQE